MPQHLTARIAWHMDGWNGHVCNNPASNYFCVGQHSYPGEMIRERRKLEEEMPVAGKCCAELGYTPPCMYSINAFGAKELKAHSDPPAFFFGEAKRKDWSLPPATVCVWPYEEMYNEDAKTEEGYFDYAKRHEAAKEFFAKPTRDSSLVFYYANYSNPFSTDDAQRYVLVGVARLKNIGEMMYYPESTDKIKRRYGGGFVWQVSVTSHYPAQGIRVPYHLYLDQPEKLERLLVAPDNDRVCKYGSILISDDDALGLVERLIEVTHTLEEFKDTSENWQQRREWLQTLVAELWQARGLYPGLLHAADFLEFSDAISLLKDSLLKNQAEKVRSEFFAFLNGQGTSLLGMNLPSEVAQDVRRRWQLIPKPEQVLFAEKLPRFDLRKEQIAKILSPDRLANSLNQDAAAMSENPYILSEQFVGDDPDDVIPFAKIDHGVFPSPELGGQFLFAKDAPQRLRALCVDRLKWETRHTFMVSTRLLGEVNRRLEALPDWRSVSYTNQHLHVDEEVLTDALIFKDHEDKQRYVYLKAVYEDERFVERQLRKLAGYGDITFTTPVTEEHWKNWLYNPEGPIAAKSAQRYEEAIKGQIAVCAKIFPRSTAVVCGSAGTGKTTIIRSLIQAIEKAHGNDATFLLLAPTGKAADRIREQTGKPASTMHAFLARNGWLNDNLTIKRSGGKQETKYTTYIIDECSMIDLELMAALFRSIKWTSVKRLIFVGDPNQLPPIGRGRVFADVIDWLESLGGNSVGRLSCNLRQLENQLENRGTGILDLASLYVRSSEAATTRKEDAVQLFQRVQALQPHGGALDKDLEIVFWDSAEDLKSKLIKRIVADFQTATKSELNPDKPYELMLRAFKNDGSYRPEHSQVISPYRAEDFGTEALNLFIQKFFRQSSIDKVGQVSSFTYYDKVIQCRNRGGRDGLWGWDFAAQRNRQGDVFNGELGFTEPHNFDTGKWKRPGFHMEQFQVRFARKDNIAFGFGKKREKPEDNLELAYAISVHKSQGCEFEHVYFVLPKSKAALLSPELVYTGITRASKHCTVLIEQDFQTLLRVYHPSASHLSGINASLFKFDPIPEEYEAVRRKFHEEGKIHSTLAKFLVRSKSEVIISNLLVHHELEPSYEQPLFAPDGTFYLPDFTIIWRGDKYFWEHLGMLDNPAYAEHWSKKKAWYGKFFPGRLLTTEEGGDLTAQAESVVKKLMS